MSSQSILIGCIATAAVIYGQGVTSASAERALLDQYCVACHNQRLKTAGLMLDKLDLAAVGENAQTWEKVVRKIRAGMMPPAGMRRPDPPTYEAMTVWLENELDRHTVTNLPPPGLHRLNRTEYANVIRDLLALDIDPAKFLPSDDSTRGFDNVAGALSLSPALLEGYTSAAGKISRMAIGDVTAPSETVYRVPEDSSQDYHIEGLPFGTRGGMLVKHEFPADGEYGFKIFPINKGLMDNNQAFGEIRGEKLELLVDGERVKLYDWDREVARGAAIHAGTTEVRVPVKAGLHTIGVTFLATNYAPGNDLDEHFLRSTIETGGLPGFTFYPHVGKINLKGPYNAKGAADSPSRRNVFACRPAGPGQETACAQQIVSTLAHRAFRRPVTNQDTEVLMSFYQQGRNQGDFDHGIEMALRRILADPEFVFRKEAEPANVKPGEKYRISDLELASRLSFFLWSSIPDDELLNLASQNKLHDPAVLDQQVRRMLADSRSDALVINFAGQWLNLRGLQAQVPVTSVFPDFDDNLRYAMRKETELFVDSIVHEDRSVIDLLNADYTFVNERLAKHYGIPNVYGSSFRRVALPPDLDMRRGLLGHGSILTVSSQPGRTSPVSRGKTVMQIFLGISPPDPPPNVPALKENATDVHGGSKPTMRQQMEMHRSVEPCASCHKIMDPIGFSLENFDAIGQWRTQDDGSPIDPAGVLVDGSKLDGVAGLRRALLRYSPQFVRVVTEKLMIYALGRGTEYYDMPLIRSIVHQAEPGNYRFSSLVLGVVKSDPFLMNMK
jgi:cytochrome c551/c552